MNSKNKGLFFLSVLFFFPFCKKRKKCFILFFSPFRKLMAIKWCLHLPRTTHLPHPWRQKKVGVRVESPCPAQPWEPRRGARGASRMSWTPWSKGKWKSSSKTSQKVRPGKLAKIFCVLFFSADPLDTYTFQSCHFLLCLLFLASRIKDLTVLIYIRGQFCQCPIIANVFSFSLETESSALFVTFATSSICLHWANFNHLGAFTLLRPSPHS